MDSSIICNEQKRQLYEQGKRQPINTSTKKYRVVAWPSCTTWEKSPRRALHECVGTTALTKLRQEGLDTSKTSKYMHESYTVQLNVACVMPGSDEYM